VRNNTCDDESDFDLSSFKQKTEFLKPKPTIILKRHKCEIFKTFNVLKIKDWNFTARGRIKATTSKDIDKIYSFNEYCITAKLKHKKVMECRNFNESDNKMEIPQVYRTIRAISERDVGEFNLKVSHPKNLLIFNLF
jgi:hypothetical protein